MNLMKTRSFLAFAFTATAAFALGLAATSDVTSRFLRADIFESPETGLQLWYLGTTDNERDWNIPTKLGAIAELPLGIAAANPDSITPVDSVEFRIVGMPDFLTFDSSYTFPGFHVDVVEQAGQSLYTNDISVFITPEEFSDIDTGIPGSPANDQLGNLIQSSNEILQIGFRVDATPTTDTEPISVTAVITKRDGDFTRLYADSNPNLPGNNSGTIIVVPQYATYPRIVETRALSDEMIELDFDTPLLTGTGNPGAENNINYYIYACGSSIPGSDANDPNAIDAEDCRQLTQQSVADPGTPVIADLNSEDASKVRITTELGVSFSDGVHYIVLVANVGNATAEDFIPAEGIYSQPFLWTVHPTVKQVIPMDVGILHVLFNNPICAGEGEYDPTDATNYEVVACNLDSPYAECVARNVGDEAGLAISDVMFDGNRTVALFTEPQAEDVYYAVRVMNLRDESCAPESQVLSDPGHISEQFYGYNSMPSGGGELAIAISDAFRINLPWREELRLKPTGGIPPYDWFLEPTDAGSVEIDEENGEVIFRPALIDSNNQAFEAERDVTLTLIDGNEHSYSIQIHVLRRGDLGGRSAQLMDKTDIQDVNDISAGWKR